MVITREMTEAFPKIVVSLAAEKKRKQKANENYSTALSHTSGHIRYLYMTGSCVKRQICVATETGQKTGSLANGRMD